MNDQLLRSFLEVSKSLNFSKAAENLHVTQPTISQQIVTLENELDCQLFVRNKKSVLLTPAGEALIPHAQSILGSIETAIAEVRYINRQSQNSLTIYDLGFSLNYALPGFITDFRSRFPQIKLNIKRLSPSAIENAFLSNKYDIAFIKDYAFKENIFADSLKLADLHLALVISESQLHESKLHIDPEKPVHLNDFKSIPFYFFDSESYHWKQKLVQLCQASGFRPLIESECFTMDDLLSLVETGGGITICDRESVQYHKRASLLCLDIADFDPSASIKAVWNQDSKSPALKTFLKHLEFWIS